MARQRRADLTASASRRAFIGGVLAIAGCGRVGEPGYKPPPFARTADESLEARLRARSQPFLRAEPNAGLAVVMARPGSAKSFGYGRIGYHDPRAPTADSVFELGTLTMTFTAVLLAELVARGRVRYETPVEELLPAGTRVPAVDDRKITLLDLATHTSGLPHMPDNFVATERGSRASAYRPEMLHRYLERATLSAPPGQRVLYSNLGYGLLGYALAKHEARSFGQLLEERVLGPLGMHSSGLYDRAVAYDDRLVEGFDERGQRVAPRFDAPTLAGCCALRTSPNDLLHFMRALHTPPPNTLGSALRETQAPRRTLEDGSEIGLGWRRDVVRGVVFKDGESRGMRSALLFEPAERRALGVLVSSARVDAVSLAFELLRETTLPGAPTLRRPRPTVSQLPNGAVAAFADFQGILRLVGWSLERPSARPGETLRITLFFQCTKRTQHDLQVFVQGEDASRRVRVTADHYPAKGQAPTYEWQPGEIIADEFALRIPGGIEPGPLALWVGFFLGGRRLPATASPTVDPGGRARGPALEISR